MTKREREADFGFAFCIPLDDPEAAEALVVERRELILLPGKLAPSLSD